MPLQVQYFEQQLKKTKNLTCLQMAHKLSQKLRLVYGKVIFTSWPIGDTISLLTMEGRAEEAG